jgi:hypothetical protein
LHHTNETFLEATIYCVKIKRRKDESILEGRKGEKRKYINIYVFGLIFGRRKDESKISLNNTFHLPQIKGIQ